MKLVAVIVTYNGKKWYDKCIGSLMTSSIYVDIIIVDNASSDDTVEYLSTHYPSIHIIRNQTNLGFAKANNIGIKYALLNNADYIFLLNQDAWVEENTIEILLQTFKDNPNVGIASPIHLNGSYTGIDAGFCNYMGVKCISDAYMNKLQTYYKVPFVNAAAWLISNECICKVGGFDTCLFKHYGEDDNYAQRVIYHGMQIVINTQCTICHDREKRLISPLNSSFNLHDIYYSERITKGNILMDYDSVRHIYKKKVELFRAYIGLHPKRIKRIKGELIFERSVEYSRRMNMKGGLVWL